MIQIIGRRRISQAMATSPCKACGRPFKFVDPAYVLTVRVDGHTHTPRVCTACNRHSDALLIMELIADARRVQGCEDIFVTSYVKQLAVQE